MMKEPDTAPGRPVKRAKSKSVLPTPDRDAEFYNDSGDCVILVENTLFKVHRFILIRHSPVFSTLFALPHGASAAEGLSDDLPISLSDDKAQDFRSLFKYLYAPRVSFKPTFCHWFHSSRSAFATQANSIPVTDLPDIIAVAKISNKYEICVWRDWALLVIT
ncbi:hypothetical protein B0H16DRAFT_1530686 [Mycena metata]|uniref:BTB domain-containing protein n=1 Tax=Mycena metata TaxID=1033252 RepID=A0AAD7JEK3_9AGAR|nr:hypothetical protein B0H16DRAFT_1530686 [Mycena metata]